MRIIKKNNRELPLFPKNVVHFGFFTNEMDCERGKHDLSNKVIVLNAQVSSYFNTKMPEKGLSKNIIRVVYSNYCKSKSAKEIADMFSLQIRTVYNIISRA